MSRLKQTVIITVCLLVIVTGVFTLVRPETFIIYKTDTDFEYTEEDGHLILTKYNGSNKNLTVPAQIASKPVKTLQATFFENNDIRNVKISDGIECIDYMSFYGCGGLLRVEIPPSVKVIGHAAFLGCVSLEEINSGSGVTEIMPYAFSDCTFLRKIKLSDTLLFIGENAFQRCKRLEKIEIPASTEIIGGVTEKKSEDLQEDLRGSTAHTSFDGCEALEINISPQNPWYEVRDGEIVRKGN